MVREFVLMVFLTSLFLLVGYLVGLYLGSPITAAGIGLVMAAISNIATYYYSDRIVLRMTHAKVVSPEEPAARGLYGIVSKVSTGAGIPMPKVAIVNTRVPNAFATGRSPDRGVVAVTTGLTETLNENEVEAVVAHEVGHIMNRDTLISAMAATVAGAISYLAWITHWGLLSGGGSRNRGVHPLVLLFTIILVPIAATLIRTAISRAREYKADLASARITRKPLDLGSALQKIEAYSKRGGIVANPATASLWIVNPFRGETLVELFSTHPSTAKRVERLRELASKVYTGEL